MEDRLRKLLASEELVTYGAWVGEELVGAVTIRWAEPSEIEIIAVASAFRRNGYGSAIISAILDEAKSRGIRRMLVATASISLDNILFYQKCGFRMSHVRRDSSMLLEAAIVWQGIALRDMLVFDYLIEVRTPR